MKQILILALALMVGNFLKAQFANCRIGIIDPVSEENQKFFWEWVLEEIIEKLKENS